MTDCAASTLALLKKKSQISGRSFQLCLQLFCQEEFLRRLAHSEYQDNLILKGGLFLYTLTNFDSRITVDVDFLLRRLPNTPEAMQKIVEEIITTASSNDYVHFSITKTVPINVQQKYPGISISLVAQIKNTKTPFSIDFAVGDILSPNAQRLKVPTQLEGFESPVIKAYSIESTIAEKLDAILSLMEFSSRMKDYFDLYYLSGYITFDGDLLSNALSKTFANRNRVFHIEQFQRMLSFQNDNSMHQKWDTFCRKTQIKNISFSEVLETIEQFLSEPFKNAITNRAFARQWNPVAGIWE